MHGQQGNDLNVGKNMEFQGQNGQIDLKDSVSQGAGSLTFRDNYTVTTSNGSTWTGAGIIVDNGVSVNWQVNGVKGDNLHKIGEGTLTVQGTGINEGGLKVGDGKVVLNQQADNKGLVQAFSSVNIASGRPTVVLTDERQVNTLHASSMNIAMGVSTADNTGDRIDILNKATGGHNTLDLSSLFDQTATLKNDLTLASAPVGTSHGYFSFASLNRGFTVYTPDTQVQEKDGRVYWQLKSHAGTTESQVSTDVSDDVTDTTSPVAPDTGSTGSTGSTEADGIVSEGNNSNGVTPSPDSPADNAGTAVNGSTLFKAADNTSLLKKARAMFAAREFILSDSADRWTQVVDNSDADGGAWAITGYSQGGYDGFSLNQSGLNVGFRQSAAGNAWWGMGAEFYRGHSSTDDYRDDFSLWGVHVLVGKSFTGGLFVDGMAGYRELSEDYTIQGELSDLSGRAKSHILTAGIRSGLKIHAAFLDMTITPTVSLNGARVDGNRLQGRERSVELHDGDVLWLKAGGEAEKVSGNMTLKAGVWRNITLNDMPGMTLRDDWKVRHYDAKKADRYTISFGVNGKMTEKLSVQAKVNSSFDGYIKTDAEGILGIRYSF